MVFLGQSPKEEATHFIKKRQYQKAEVIMQNYVKIYPQDWEAIELLGDAYGYQEKWDNAILHYKRLVELDKSNANYHYKYGGALALKAQSVSKIRALGLIRDIKRAFLTAIKLDVKHIDARWALVDLYITLPGIVGGSTKKALQYTNELYAISLVDGYLAKGYVYEYDNKPKLAEENYKKAIEIGSTMVSSTDTGLSQKTHKRNAIYYQLGKVSADYNLALQQGERYLIQYIENHTSADGVPLEWAYYRLAQIYKHKSETNKALNYIDKALALRPDFKQALQEKNRISSK